MEMKIVQVGVYRFKVRPEDLERYLRANPDGVVIGDKATPTQPDPVVENSLVSSASTSHSDAEIDQVNAIVERVPDLTAAQAKAIVAAGFTLATLPRDYDALVEINGIADKSAKKILEALNA